MPPVVVWAFRTEKKDIALSVTLVSGVGVETVQAAQRFPSHQKTIEGMHRVGTRVWDAFRSMANESARSPIGQKDMRGAVVCRVVLRFDNS